MYLSPGWETRGSQHLGVLDPGSPGECTQVCREQMKEPKGGKLAFIGCLLGTLSYLGLIIDEVAIILYSFFFSSEDVEIRKEGPRWILFPLLPCVSPLCCHRSPSLLLPSVQTGSGFSRSSPIQLLHCLLYPIRGKLFKRIISACVYFLASCLLSDHQCLGSASVVPPAAPLIKDTSELLVATQNDTSRVLSCCPSQSLPPSLPCFFSLLSGKLPRSGSSVAL